MTELILVLLLLCIGVLSCVAGSGAARRRRLHRELARADARIFSAHREAARAMNRAAGQSYRNLVE